MKDLNQLFDYIIIGGSKEGLDVFEFLNKINKKVLLIDEKEHDFENSYLGTAVYFSYYRGINRIETKNKNNESRLFCCLNVILATGTSPNKSTFPVNVDKNIENVFYNKIPVDLTKFEKNHCIVVGDSKAALEGALKLSDTFEKVFVCKPDFSIKSKSIMKKMDEKSNIIMFNGDSVVQTDGIIIDNNTLKVLKVFLKSYARISSDLIIVYSGTYPETSTFTTQLIKIDSDMYCEVDENYCSTVMKNIYAIGAIARNYKKTKFINYLKEKHEVK
jgi:thioredoxin reductase